MALISCPACGQTISDGVAKCPLCGHNMQQQTGSPQPPQPPVPPQPPFQSRTGNYVQPEEDNGEATNDYVYKLVRPFLGAFDSGNFFRIYARVVVYINAVICLLGPIIANCALAGMVTNGFFFKTSDKVKTVLLAFLLVAILSFLGFMGFSYWMKRLRKINAVFASDKEYIAIPVSSYLTQWSGEWWGIFAMMLSPIVLVLSLLCSATMRHMPGALAGIGVSGSIGLFVYGAMIVVGTRIFAEFLRVLTSIAKNTKHTATQNLLVEVEELEEERAARFNFNYVYIGIAAINVVIFLFYFV